MARYGLSQHKDRIALRSDLTSLVTHLTRAKPKVKQPENAWDAIGPAELVPNEIEADALDVLMTILESQTIKGSSNSQPGKKGYIVGNQRAACFQETPIYGLGQMFFQEQLIREKQGKSRTNGRNVADYRYTLYGIAFARSYLWKKGGRPVFYEQSNKAKDMLIEDQWWRIVDLNYESDEKMVDWTHEREWRVKNDFQFDLQEAIVILPDTDSVKDFMAHEKQVKHEFFNKVKGVIPVGPIFF